MSLTKCDSCGGWFTSDYFQGGTCIKQHALLCKEQSKMTREEAVKVTESVMKYRDGNWTANKCVECFEALGLLKFDEPKKEVVRLCSYERNDLGMIKIEEWPEGLVLWVGGEIKWKSWVDYYKTGDTVAIRNTNSDNILGFIK